MYLVESANRTVILYRLSLARFSHQDQRFWAKRRTEDILKQELRFLIELVLDLSEALR